MVFLYHSICSPGARHGGTSTHGEPPLAIHSMTDTHDHPEANQLGVKVEIGMIFMQDTPPNVTRTEQWHITHHQCSHFLEDPIIKYPSGAIRKAYESTNPHLCLVGCVHQMWPYFWVCALDVVLKEAILGTFCSDKEPCIVSMSSVVVIGY